MLHIFGTKPIVCPFFDLIVNSTVFITSRVLAILFNIGVAFKDVIPLPLARSIEDISRETCQRCCFEEAIRIFQIGIIFTRTNSNLSSTLSVFTIGFRKKSKIIIYLDARQTNHWIFLPSPLDFNPFSIIRFLPKTSTRPIDVSCLPSLRFRFAKKRLANRNDILVTGH